MQTESKLIDSVIMSKFLIELLDLQSKYGIYIDADIDYKWDYDSDDNLYEMESTAIVVYYDKDDYPIPAEVVNVDVSEFKETPEPTSKRLKRETEKLINELEHWKNLL